MAPPRIILATVGTLGDLHPFIAIGLALTARGADPLLAVPQDHVARCHTAGLKAAAIMPTFAEIGRATGLSDEEVVACIVSDHDFMFRRILLAGLGDSTTRLHAVAQEADLILGSSFALAAPIVAEELAIPYAHVVLQPMSWLMPEEPPAIPAFRLSARPPVSAIGLAWNRLLIGLGVRMMRRRYGPIVDRVRLAHGLGPAAAAPISAPGTPPVMSLGLYSPLLGRQPPGKALLTGFPWFDGEEGHPATLDPALAAFLAEGPPPLVVSLGSFVPLVALGFYDRAAAIGRALGLRVVILSGEQTVTPVRDVFAIPYAPHSILFPRAGIIIHHGGIGTTGQALRAGRPQLVVPFMGDQPDQAARIARLGTGLSLPPARFDREAGHALRRLIEEPDFAVRAGEIGERVAREDGAAVAADAILALTRR